MESKETLEEAAEKYANKYAAGESYERDVEEAVKFGAKWQAEKSYSEEDMQDFAKFCLLCKDEELPYIFPKDWLKHIKKEIK